MSCCCAPPASAGGGIAFGAPSPPPDAQPVFGDAREKGSGGKDGAKGGASSLGDVPPLPSGTGSTKGDDAVQYAKQFLGKPYVYAASGPDSFDCSGLTQYVMKHFGVDLPHNAAEQAKLGKHISSVDDLQPGDLVFFKDSSGIHHTGMYIGDHKFIHAPHTGDVVKISSLDESYYRNEFAGGSRFL